MNSDIIPILERAHAIEILLTIDGDPGRPMSYYFSYHNTKVSFARVNDLEEAGLVRSDRMKKHNTRTMYPTIAGHILAVALRGAVDVIQDLPPTNDTPDAPKPWTGHACDDCGNASIGRHGETICKGHGPVDYPLVSVCEEWTSKRRCVDCANYFCDEDLGPACRRNGQFRLVAFPYAPGCDQWRGA